VKFPYTANDNRQHGLIHRTRRTWQPRLGRELSCEDARQIIENASGFFAVLAEWSHSDRDNPANDNESADGSTTAASLAPEPAGAPDHG
jgi:hypothetical protein